MAEEADNGKTVRNTVKLPVSGCKISVTNKFLMKLPVLSASLAKSCQSVGAWSLKVSSYLVQHRLP